MNYFTSTAAEFAAKFPKLRRGAAKASKPAAITPAVAAPTITPAAITPSASPAMTSIRERSAAFGVTLGKLKASQAALRSTLAAANPAGSVTTAASAPIAANATQALLGAIDRGYAATRTNLEAGAASLAAIVTARAGLGDTVPASIRNLACKIDAYSAQAKASRVRYSEIRAINAIAGARALVKG